MKDFKKANFKKINVKKVIIQFLITLLIYGVCIGFCSLLDYFKINDLNFIIIFVLGILITAILTDGFFFSILLSIVSVFTYNFLYTVPKFTFHFNEKSYMFTFLLMFFISVIVSTLTYVLKKKMTQVKELAIEKNNLKNNIEKEKMKAMLLRSISHDLRTPLTAIKNGSEVLLDGKDITKDEEHEIIEGIYSKSDWTIRLVENLLTLSRIDGESLTVKKQDELLEEIIPQAVRNVETIIGNRKIHYDIPDDIVVIKVDATLIIQVITNILANAIHHTDDNGNIYFKVWQTGKHTVIRIKNDGSQINTEDLPHIFEPYYRGGDNQKTNGFGLGLSICKIIITAHGGTIEANNDPVKGVYFQFALPNEDDKKEEEE